MSSNANNVIAPALSEQTCSDLYIPRISPSYTEDDVKFMFQQANIAHVEYVDFVKLKPVSDDCEIKYCAFVKIGWWYTPVVFKEIDEKGSHKFFLAHTGKPGIPRDNQYWLLLPNKTPLARSKVNIHQLAAYTDELFAKMEDQAQEMEKQKECIYEQGLQLQEQKLLIEEQTVQIKHLFNLCSFQNSQIAQLHYAFQRALTDDDENGEDTCLEPVDRDVAEQIVIRSATSSPTAAMETVDLLDWDKVEHCVEPVAYSHKVEDMMMDNLQIPSCPPPLVRSNTVFLSNTSLDALDDLPPPPALTRQDCNAEYGHDQEEALVIDAVMEDELPPPPALTRQNCNAEYGHDQEEALVIDVVMEDELPPPPALTRQNCNPDYVRECELIRQASVSHKRQSPTEARVKYSDEICYNK
jgi:hypothetical protein